MAEPNKTIAEVLAEAAKQDTEDEVSAQDWDARRDGWLDELKWLFDQIAKWVDPSVVAGHAKWNARTPAIIKEDFIGQYDAPSFELTMGRRQLVFRPVGTLPVGSRGRVDVVGGRSSAMLVLQTAEHAWAIAKRTPRVTLTPLNEDSFAVLLAQFLSDG